jgi:(p)ppGpp synthase/HD superfamily hydrolase
MWTEGTAKRLAEAVHAGQKDKNGEAYIRHPARVAGIVERKGGTPEQVMAAWLHDVVEDSSLTLGDLATMDCPLEVIKIIDRVTQKNGQSRKEYIQAMDDEDWLVKESDTEDNQNPFRVASLPPEVAARLERKYEQDRAWRSEVA